MHTKAAGNQAEQLACDYLLKHGHHFFDRHYHCRFGEIDLIMRDQGCRVFVEVRYRKQIAFGSGADSVDQRKQKKLLTTANHYLSRHGNHNQPCRFDVISISGSLQAPNIDWIKNTIGI